MDETIQRQIMELKIYCYEGKKHLEGWSLYSIGIDIPADQRDNHFEYTQEQIDDLIERYMYNSPYTQIEIIEDYSHDVQHNMHNLR